MTNIPKSFYKTDPNLVANLAMVCEVTLNPKENTMTELEPLYVVEMKLFGEWCISKQSKRLDWAIEWLKKKRQLSSNEFCLKKIVEIEVLDD